jgi:glycosyltransferase involved in cell wall biosynthesis
MLYQQGLPVRLLLRGGLESHGAEVLRRCRDLGLRVQDVTWDGGGIPAMINAITAGSHADVLNLQVPLLDEHKRLLFRACDAVLANSSMEPFGLVGLEALAAGGIAIVGSTGEDYASDENSLRTSRGTAQELAGLIEGLAANPAVGRQLRAAGPRAARQFVWERVLVNALLPVALGARANTGVPVLQAAGAS